MGSNELVELLYVAYNRDEAEVFTVDKALRSGYEELYSTAPNVLDKRMKVLNEEIEKQALELINDKVIEVRSRKQQEIEERQARFGELIKERAEAILRQNAAYLGVDTSKKAIEMIKEEAQDKTQNEQEDKDVGLDIEPAKDKIKRGRKKKEQQQDENIETDIVPTKGKRGRPKKQIETKEEGGNENVGQETKTGKRGRKPKSSN